MAKKLGLWINGQYVNTSQWDTIQNPYTHKDYAKAALASEKEIETAIQAAIKAFPIINQLTRGQRAEILYAFASQIKQHHEELAEWMTDESGKPIDAARIEVDRLVTTLQLSAAEATRNIGEVMAVDFNENNKHHRAFYERFPIGPIAAITPFNFPLNLTAHKLGPAIAVGNTMVLKPPMQCPTVVLRLAELAQAAGLPDGVFNVVHCRPNVAETMVRDDRLKLLSFTGSAKVGWHLKSICGKKKVHLELGGNAAAIVHQDADIQNAAQRLALGAFFQSGQVCIKAQRIYVHETIWEKFTDQFLIETNKLKVGNPRNSGVIVGPMIHHDAVVRVKNWVQEAIDCGATILLDGKQDGNVLSPIVITNVYKDCKVVCEEVFGPVAIVEKIKSFEEGINQANDTQYGLQAAVFTNDIRLIDQAFRTLNVGGVIVNDFPNFRTDNFPYGGIKDSGLGREGVRYALDEMTEKRMLVVKV